MKEIEKLPEAEKIMELPISYEEKGKEIGKEIGKKEVAIEMLKEGSSLDFISRVTKLPKEEIKELKKNKDTRFYRKKMGYSTRQLRTIQGSRTK